MVDVDEIQKEINDKSVVHMYKLILVGDASVGKTSILQKFVNNLFKIEYNCTIGIDYMIKSLIIDGNKVVGIPGFP